jgi:hypothetical protein
MVDMVEKCAHTHTHAQYTLNCKAEHAVGQTEQEYRQDTKKKWQKVKPELRALCFVPTSKWFVIHRRQELLIYLEKVRSPTTS